MIVEPVQGEGGLRHLSPQFVAALNRLCSRHDVVLIADEVQAGLGRTGRLFGSEAIGLEPDIVTLSKPIAGGLPLSATLVTRRINDALALGDHGSTFGGGPVTTAVALRVWEEVSSDAFLAAVRRRAEHLDQRLRAIAAADPAVGEPLGLGLLRGLPVKAVPEQQKTVMAALIATARENGLLVLRSGANVIRIAPPLIISESEIDEGCDIVAQSIETVRRTEKGAFHE